MRRKGNGMSNHDILSFVGAEPLYLDNGQEVPGFVANTAEDGRVLGVVRSTYSIIQMRHLVEGIESALEKMDLDPDRIETKDIVSRNGSYVAREYKMPTLEGIEYKRTHAKSEVGTKMAMFFRASTSYDGSTPTRIRSGSLDLVCTNGMVTEKDFENFSKRHTMNVTIDHVALDLEKTNRAFISQVERLRSYAETPLPGLETLREKVLLFPTMTERMADRIMYRVEQEAASRGDNLYAFVSALTYYSSHDSDQFPMYAKAGGERDNVPELLAKREEQVRSWLKSKPFQELIAA